MTIKLRSIWISDTHLGGKNVKSKRLLNFLQNTESDYLYLVGDILDLLKLSRKWYWPEINNRIINLIMEKARNGTTVIYIPGNHDALFRNYSGKEINNISIHNEAIHTTLDGRRLLVLHGDRFDCVVQNNRWLAVVGGMIYDWLLVFNRCYNRYRSWRNKPYFSVSAFLKNMSKKVVNYIGNFEDHLSTEIQQQKVDGIVCGHIHSAAIKTTGGYLYTNSGDWVESCTALAENHNGMLGIIEWSRPDAVILHDSCKAYEEDRYRKRCLASTN